MKNKNSIVLITKDAYGKFYFPIYGNTYWKGLTPNIDELASKGTVFNRHYTAAPSSSMSYFSMFTGLYAYQTDRKDYLPIKKERKYETFFDKTFNLGFKNHIIWDDSWMPTKDAYERCYGDHVQFNPLANIKQSVGAHQQHDNVIKCDENKVRATEQLIESKINEITQNDEKIFLWIHLPHVTYGRNGYGTDMDFYDRIVGVLRKYFEDDNIFISADHGNMNGRHGKIGYGWDVYEEASCIPFITPRLQNMTTVDFPTSTCDLFDIIINRIIPKRDYVLSDSAYYCQVQRKLAIIKDNYKYIYNRRTRTEELYDLVYDPFETTNLISTKIYDVDRHLSSPLQEYYFYPYWEKIEPIKEELRTIKNTIWREGNTYDKIYAFYRFYGKGVWRVISAHLHKHGIDFTFHKHS